VADTDRQLEEVDRRSRLEELESRKLVVVPDSILQAAVGQHILWERSRYLLVEVSEHNSTTFRILSMSLTK